MAEQTESPPQKKREAKIDTKDEAKKKQQDAQ